MKKEKFSKENIENLVKPKYRTERFIKTVNLIFTLIEVLPLFLPLIFIIVSQNLKLDVGIFFAIEFILILIAILFYYYTEIKFKKIILKEYKIELKLKKEVKIIYVSDIHLGKSRYGTYGKRLENLIKIINNENPEIVLFGGDFLDDKLDASLLMRLSQIKAKYKLGVYGNHDAKYLSINPKEREYKIPTKFIDLIKRAGIKILVNDGEAIEINGVKLFIAGITDLYSKNFNFEQAFAKASKDSKKILLSHNPDIVDFIEENDDIDLILSGHNHAGQINIKPFGAILPIPAKHKEFQKGIYKVCKNTQLFITQGVGFTGTRFRIGTMPEVCKMVIS